MNEFMKEFIVPSKNEDLLFLIKNLRYFIQEFIILFLLTFHTQTKIDFLLTFGSWILL